MAKIKLTKNELKKQKDALKMYRRYLPTLMLKKQQLQAEIRVTENRIRELREQKEGIDEVVRTWIGVFGEKGIFVPGMLRISVLKIARGNIAGVSIPLFQGADFETQPYDLVRTPLWLDAAVDRMKQVLLLDLEAQTLEEQRKRLDHELRVTTQRVNLFEKIKIPETRGNIKKIQVYLGDQQTSAVVRGKIAKRSMEADQRSGASQ
ncbi:MAG: V-type ATP synthase subunit D [Spirochaetaceae bacterium]|jgi:V/A-type H+-transporting ATPase subunit D|nr:V-type ATP synthase subunit D [Spirochaetaceae bacterium]